MRCLRLLLPVLLAAALAGCGSDDGARATTGLDFLPGDQVGELAEKQLEAEHLEMATGTVTCPDLDWELDATVRCLKVSELSDGRRVKIPGTVTVTSTEDGGRLHVELDDRATEFGVDAGHLGTAASAWVRDRTASAAELSCPYLAGVLGTEVSCTGTAGERAVAVVARVTGVDADDFRTRFSFAWGPAPSAPEASPTFVASGTPSVVD